MRKRTPSISASSNDHKKDYTDSIHNKHNPYYQNNNYNKSFKLSLKDQTNLLESINSASYKENRRNQILNNSINTQSKYPFDIRKEESLKKLKKTQSEKLLRDFTKEIQLIQSHSDSSGCISDRIFRLQTAVQMITDVRKMLSNPQNFAFQLQKSNEKFALQELSGLLQFQLFEKQKQISSLRQYIKQLETKHKQEKYQHESDVKRYVRNSLCGMFGTNSMRKSRNNDLGNSKQLFKSDVIGTPVRNHLPLPNRGYGQVKFNQSSQKQQDDFDISVYKIREPEQGLQKQQQFLDDLQAVEEDMDIVRGSEEKYSQNIFVQNKVQTIIKIDNKYSEERLSFAQKLNQITLFPMANKVISKLEASIQTNRCDVTESNTQTEVDFTNPCEYIHPTQPVGKAGITQIISLSPELSFEKNLKLNFMPSIISISIEPKKQFNTVTEQKSKVLRICKQYQFTINIELLGSRIKVHKSLVKLSIELLFSVWHILSKHQKTYHNKQVKTKMIAISHKLNHFIDSFNVQYLQAKESQGQSVTHSFYQNTVKELKIIENQLTCLMPSKTFL